MRKISILIILSFLLLSISCDDSPTGYPVVGTITGDWLESKAVVSLILTTNSAQTAKNFLNSTGEIAVTGDYNSKLKLMFYTNYEDDENFLLALDGVGFQSDTTIQIGLNISNPAENGEMIVGVSDDSEYEDELEGPVNFTFDNVTLNINNSAMQSNDTGLNVNLNGSISVDQVSIPANSPTFINFNASHFYDFGNTVTTFNEDSTFQSSEDEENDPTGTWEVVGDTLKLTTKQEVEVEDDEFGGSANIDTTLSFGYVNNGNQFILTQSFEICKLVEVDSEEDIDCKEIYNLIEFFTHLDSNTVTDAEFNYQLFFDKIQDNQVAKASGENNNNFTQIPNKLIQYFLKTKSSINLN